MASMSKSFLRSYTHFWVIYFAQEMAQLGSKSKLMLCLATLIYNDSLSAVYLEVFVLFDSYCSNEAGILHVNRDLLRWRRDPRELDEDEEAWFDDEEESIVTATSTTPSSAPKPKPHPLNTTPFTHLSYSPRPTEDNKPPPGHYTRPPINSRSQIKVSNGYQ